MTEEFPRKLKPLKEVMFYSVQLLSRIQLSDPMHCSMPDFPVLHHLLELCSNSCPLSWWWHPTISSSVIPFFSCLQSFPASGSFQMTQFFISDGQSIGASAAASSLPVNIQDWFPLWLTGLISLPYKGLSSVFVWVIILFGLLFLHVQVKIFYLRG